MKKFLVITSVVSAFLLAFGVWNIQRTSTLDDRRNINEAAQYTPNKPDVVKTTSVLLNVPFTSQAPRANWSDPRQQDGCEEASIYMAYLWATNGSTTPEEAEKTITAISDFEEFHYGNFHDTNAADTVKVMKAYFNYQNVSFTMNPTIENIKNELRQGRLVLVPANGQKLNNPNFKPPGPVTHMLVIRGFDDASGKFTTNDPGTRLGEGYIYDYSTVYDAMVDYPTGTHESQEGRPKSMIVVSK